MKTIIGVMGPGATATEHDCELARQLGRLIAGKGWVLLAGGRPIGVMQAASEAAKEAGGITVGILPAAEPVGISDSVDIPILTGMGEARNVVNVLSSRVVLVCGMNVATASEGALAMKAGRPVVLVCPDAVTTAFFCSLNKEINEAQDAEDAIRLTERLLS